MKNFRAFFTLILAMATLCVAGCNTNGGGDDGSEVSSLHNKINALQQQVDAGNPVPSQSSDDFSNDQKKDTQKDYSDPNDKYKPLCLEDSDCLSGQLCNKGQCQDDPNAVKQDGADQCPQVAADATYKGKTVIVTFDREISFDTILRDSLEVDGGTFYAVSVKPENGNNKIAVFELQDLPKEGVPYKFVLHGGQGLGPKDAKTNVYMTTDRVWHHTYTQIAPIPPVPGQQ